MIALKLLCVCVLLGRASWAATVAPPPNIQTLDASHIGPEYTQVTNSTTQNGTEAKVIEDAKFWHEVAMKQLTKVVDSAKNVGETSYKKKAKNIIIFVGDGMGLTTITAGRIYKGQYLKMGNGEETTLAFDNFPFTGLAKTYNVDKQVPDSAGTATAMFCGIKTDYGAIGMDTTRNESNATQGRLQSIMDWAQAENKRTGIVTTTRITHATPAAAYARVYHRDWECDTEMPEAGVKGQHMDIARQLVESEPGNKLNVILGGGLSPMGALNAQETRRVKFEGSTEKVCQRGDGRNLVEQWLNDGDSQTRTFVQSREQLMQVNVDEVDHLLGLFRNNHITYAIAQEEEEPSLQEMTEAAIGVLERGADSQGYVLIVEGGRIDQGHHQNYAHAALHEVYEFDRAIAAAVSMTNPSETLILVTADHSHAVTLNGYPKRGTDILGFGSKSSDFMAYETISYANGPGFWDHLANGTNSNGAAGSSTWLPLESMTEERAQPTYRHMATVPRDDETHGGEDVIVFAHGPGASLVRGVFEQNYLAYVMSYAGCMGPAKDFDGTCSSGVKSGASAQRASWVLAILMLVLCIKTVYKE